MFSIKRESVKPPPCVVDSGQTEAWLEDRKAHLLSPGQGKLVKENISTTTQHTDTTLLLDINWDFALWRVLFSHLIDDSWFAHN